MDGAGNAYITGVTESSDFPITSSRRPFGRALNGSSDAFVTKLSPSGSLIYSTFFGGSESEGGRALTVDDSGAIYLAGFTNSPDLPTSRGAFQRRYSGSGADAFVTKLSADGAAIVYSTYLGGTGGDSPIDIALDSNNAAYIVGEIERFGASNVTFPLVNPIQANYGGGLQDVFLSILDPNGSSLLFSTFLDVGLQSDQRQAGDDDASSLVVNVQTGDVYLGGRVKFSVDDPGVPFLAGFRRATPMLQDSHFAIPAQDTYLIVVLFKIPEYHPFSNPQNFALKVSFALVFGVVPEETQKRAQQNPGSHTSQQTSGIEPVALVVGRCHPIPPATTCTEAAAVARFDQDLNFKNAANVRGSRDFFIDAATMDAQGAVYILGDTQSRRLQTVNPIQATLAGNSDPVIAVYAPQTLEPAFVTYLGGSTGFAETPVVIAVDPPGNIYITGIVTLTTDFPTTPGAFQRELKGGIDAFIVKISPVGPF